MKRERMVVAASFLFGVLIWAGGAVLDHFFPHVETLSVVGFSVPLHEVYVLATTLSGILTFGLLAAGAISKRRLVEKSLRERTVELQTRNEELDAFSHTVAHDLKAALQSIVGFAELLQERYSTLSDDEKLATLGRIARGGRKMGNIIDELLLLSEVRSVGGEAVPLDMGGIVAEVRRRLVSKIDLYQAEIVVPTTWPMAIGRSSWIEQVWLNYLDNALKYGGRPPRIELGADQQADGLVRFWVQDNGPGVSKKDRSSLFAPFTRLEQVQVAGHGLGLSIARRIVEKLGGQVGVESAEGRGSLFYFTLPRAVSGCPAEHSRLNAIRYRPRERARLEHNVMPEKRR